MSPCTIAAAVIGILILVGFALTVPDILKYIELKNM
jgi:hypothetical protein